MNFTGGKEHRELPQREKRCATLANNVFSPAANKTVASGNPDYLMGSNSICQHALLRRGTAHAHACLMARKQSLAVITTLQFSFLFPTLPAFVGCEDCGPAAVNGSLHPFDLLTAYPEALSSAALSGPIKQKC